jgi:hypothetical protein
MPPARSRWQRKVAQPHRAGVEQRVY